MKEKKRVVVCNHSLLGRPDIHLIHAVGCPGGENNENSDNPDKPLPVGKPIINEDLPEKKWTGGGT